MHQQTSSIQYTGSPAFQGTHVNTEEFVEHWYQRHTGALVMLLWEYQHLIC